MSTCSLYIPRPVDPAREFYGVAQVNCGTCQQWDADREKCRQEADLAKEGFYNGEEDKEGDHKNKKPGKAV